MTLVHVYKKMARFKGKQFLNQGELTPPKLCLAQLQYLTNVSAEFRKNPSKTVEIHDTKLLEFDMCIEKSSREQNLQTRGSRH